MSKTITIDLTKIAIQSIKQTGLDSQDELSEVAAIAASNSWDFPFKLNKTCIKKCFTRWFELYLSESDTDRSEIISLYSWMFYHKNATTESFMKKIDINQVFEAINFEKRFIKLYEDKTAYIDEVREDIKKEKENVTRRKGLKAKADSIIGKLPKKDADAILEYLGLDKRD